MLVAVSALVFAASGRDGRSGTSSIAAPAATTGGSTEAPPTTAATGGGQDGGTMSAYMTSSPDYMDPALSYTQEGWLLLWTAYTPLLTYKHEEGAEGSKLIPGL